MRKIPALLLLVHLVGLPLTAQENAIRLLVRGDDMGMCRAVNEACIEAWQNGIMRSVELMVPVPWFLDAVFMLNENPGLDAGIHLTLTSEWSGLKWSPLTNAESIVDSNGFFFPMVWPNQNFPPKTSIYESDWKIDDIESELRAQIEMGLKHLPRISHLSTHMGFTGLDERIKLAVERLSREYNLPVYHYDESIKPFGGWKGAETLQQRIDIFIENLRKLTPGTYLFIEHPGKDSPEMRAVRHPGYENVVEDREWVTRVFTSPEIIAAVEQLGIELISYKDLIEHH